MLVISTNCLIGVLIGLYASVVSAIPTVVTQNTTELLEARVPDDNRCREMQWLSRECASGSSSMAWNDVCRNQHFTIRVPGFCPDNTVCEDILDVDENDRLIETIQCNAPAPPGTSKPRERDDDPQIGSSTKRRAVTQLANTQMHHEVFIADDMTASISAILLGDDEKSIVRPGNIIVGKVRGKDITACKGDPSYAWRFAECFPTGRYQLRFGDAIDFTWGMKSNQIGSLKYIVFPS